MLPSNMNFKLKIGTVGYNNKILVSDGKFSLGKNEKVNSLKTATMKSPQTADLEGTTATHRDLEQTSTTQRDLEQKPNIIHEEEKIAFVLFLAGGFAIWNMF